MPSLHKHRVPAWTAVPLAGLRRSERITWWQRVQVQFWCESEVSKTALCETNQLFGEHPIKRSFLMETVTRSGCLVVYEMTA